VDVRIIFQCGAPREIIVKSLKQRAEPGPGVCLEVRGEIIRTVLCCIVYDSCTQSYAHLDEQFLQFSGLGFVTLGAFHCAQPTFGCAYLCVFCAFVFHTAYVLCYCQHSGVELMPFKPSP